MNLILLKRISYSKMFNMTSSKIGNVNGVLKLIDNNCWSRNRMGRSVMVRKNVVSGKHYHFWNIPVACFGPIFVIGVHSVVMKIFKVKTENEN